jgi:Zn-dependent M28 family amino/carboxypeptidase
VSFSKKLVLLAIAVPLFAAAIDYAAEGKLWWAHVQFLADDKLQGRDIGTEGFAQAVTYVSGRFQQLGLKPAGDAGYLQTVKFESRQLIQDQCSLTLIKDDAAEELTLGTDASLSARADLAQTWQAPMVFVGYGLVIPEAHWNDLEGIDLKGKIAVYVNAPSPADAPAAVKSHLTSAAERWNVLHKAGAVGMATIAAGRGGAGRGTAAVPDADAASVANGANAATTAGGAVATLPGADNSAAAPGGGRGGRGASQPSISLADPALSETTGMAVSIAITPRGAEKFLEGSGHTFAEIQQLARENKPLPRFPLAVQLRSQVALKRETLDSPNIAAMFPGTGKLKDEYVIFSAHLDHVGVGRPVNGDNIYNGAMDNASGVASVLEVARLLKESKAKTNRSIIFLTVTAEEKGELGSRYFAARPTVPFKQIVADINLDMFLPLYPLKVIEVQGLMESTLGDAVKAAAEADGVAVQIDQEPEQNRFTRSDQYSFIRRGIPALAFKFGYEKGSPDETTRKNWVRDRYHKPSDDLSQPVDTEAAARFNRIMLRLIERVADDPARPAWREDSFFRRFAVAER